MRPRDVLTRVTAILSLDGLTRDAGEGDETYVCRECGDAYVLVDGGDPSPECDRCAQAILARVREILAAPDPATYLDGPRFLRDGFADSLAHPTRKRHLRKAARLSPPSRRTARGTKEKTRG